MLILLAILWVVTPAQVGSIHILVEPNAAIFLDGRQLGISSSAAGGFMIESVAVGDHDITVKTSYGGSVSKKVTVNEGQDTTITISSLGLRTRSRGDDAALEVQTTLAGSTSCNLLVGTERFTANAEELRGDRLRPGSQNVTVTCGDKRATGNIDLPSGKIVTVQADFAKGKLISVGDRPRVTAVYVQTVEDRIMRLDLPFSWKRAVAASLVANVKPRSITRLGMVQLEVTMEGPSYNAIAEFARNIQQRPEVKNVYIKSWDYYLRGGGSEATYVVTFQNSQ